MADAPRNLMDIRREAAAKQNDLSRQLMRDLSCPPAPAKEEKRPAARESGHAS